MRKPKFKSSSIGRGQRLGIRSSASRRAEELGIKKPVPVESIDNAVKEKPDKPVSSSLDDIMRDGNEHNEALPPYAEGREEEFLVRSNSGYNDISNGKENSKTYGKNSTASKAIHELLDPANHSHESNGIAKYSARRRARDKMYADIERRRIKEFMAESLQNGEAFSCSYTRDVFRLMNSRGYPPTYKGFAEFRKRHYFDVKTGIVRARRDAQRRYSGGKRISPSEVYAAARARE
ncbi:MAG TPA: hypothetical protein VJG30_01970 [Candidatus Nanoarchaeia archaeon]|nr:hypothetical protein [Candidatus Nanoarchaeia archaeon]